MKLILPRLCVMFAVLAGVFPPLPKTCLEVHAVEPPQIRMLLVTGGHGFETNRFLNFFTSNPVLTVQAVAHPNAHSWFKADKAGQYDVIVLYDMWQDISEEAKKDFLDRLKEGKGLVALHHSLASYQKWDEYAKVIGGKFRLEKQTQDGVERPASTFKHDVKIPVKVIRPPHPATAGLKDFEIQDETYGRFEVAPSSIPLLATDEPTSGRTICWATSYGMAKVAYIQLGHDHVAWDNPNYRRLVMHAIRWTVGQR